MRRLFCYIIIHNKNVSPWCGKKLPIFSNRFQCNMSKVWFFINSLGEAQISVCTSAVYRPMSIDFYFFWFIWIHFSSTGVALSFKALSWFVCSFALLINHLLVNMVYHTILWIWGFFSIFYRKVYPLKFLAIPLVFFLRFLFGGEGGINSRRVSHSNIFYLFSCYHISRSQLMPEFR